MEQGILITRRENHILLVRVENDKITQIQAEPVDGSILGDIYIGKVRNIVKNINAAFVEFKKGQMGYLSLAAPDIPIHTGISDRQDDRVLIGDEIIVQVEREAVKSKPPTLTGVIELPGCYVVLTTKKSVRNSVSKKIKDNDKREWLQSILVKYATEEYGFVARTNSECCEEDVLTSEIEDLVMLYDQIKSQGEHRVIFSRLYQAPCAYLSQIRDSSQKTTQEIITDDDELCEELSGYLISNRLTEKMLLTRWNPDDGKMDAVFDISRTIERAMRPKVWLKNGAYLIIQPTEALIAIDVNSGKAVSKKKDVEKTYYSVNIEAAKEIARQLRLRNLSGVIIVDFIDMKKDDNKEELMKVLRQEVKKDPVQTTVVDMTALGLVEITRKKIRKSLFEQLNEGDKGEEA